MCTLGELVSYISHIRSLYLIGEIPLVSPFYQEYINVIAHTHNQLYLQLNYSLKYQQPYFTLRSIASTVDQAASQL